MPKVDAIAYASKGHAARLSKLLGILPPVDIFVIATTQVNGYSARESEELVFSIEEEGTVSTPLVRILRTLPAVIVFGLTMLTGTVIVNSVEAQGPPTLARPPVIVSPEVSADRHITFRLMAPNA